MNEAKRDILIFWVPKAVAKMREKCQTAQLHFYLCRQVPKSFVAFFVLLFNITFNHSYEKLNVFSYFPHNWKVKNLRIKLTSTALLGTFCRKTEEAFLGTQGVKIQFFFTAAVWFSGTKTIVCKRIPQIVLSRCDLSRVAESKRSTSKSPVKRAGPSTAARQASGTGRSTQGTSNTAGNRTGQASYNRARATKRECPLSASCDSRGHLSGKLDSHFTLEACPLYHNTTPQACV